MTQFATRRIAIIGGGMAGAACATALQAAGRSVAVFDKGRGPGGRMSTRRIAMDEQTLAFDHGAQYFTARDPRFLAQVTDWHRRGIVAPWPAAGDGAWVGTPGMNRPVAALTAALDVAFQTEVRGLSRQTHGWYLDGIDLDPGPYAQVVIAVPAEQAARLLQDISPAMSARAAATPSQPCWTAMAVFDQRLDRSEDIWRGDGDILWAARNSAKPGRDGPEAWVIQASPAWSARHLGADGAAVGADLLRLFAGSCNILLPSPRLVQAHSWLYARSGASAGPDHLWDADLGIGVCGDWLIGPRVESAWLSGDSLARDMLSFSYSADLEKERR